MDLVSLETFMPSVRASEFQALSPGDQARYPTTIGLHLLIATWRAMLQASCTLAKTFILI